MKKRIFFETFQFPILIFSIPFHVIHQPITCVLCKRTGQNQYLPYQSFTTEKWKAFFRHLIVCFWHMVYSYIFCVLISVECNGNRKLFYGDLGNKTWNLCKIMTKFKNNTKTRSVEVSEIFEILPTLEMKVLTRKSDSAEFST